MKEPKASQRAGRSARVSRRSRRVRRPRQERSRLTCEAIVGAAERLLVERGYAAASTNAIARRAGVSVGSLYQYFSGKDAVFREILARHRAEMAPIEQRALRAVAEGREDLRSVMERSLQESLAVRDRNPALMTALHGEPDGIAARWAEDAGAGKQAAVAQLGRAFAARLGLSRGRARARAWLTLTVLESVARGLVHGAAPRPDRQQITRLTVDMLATMLESGERGAGRRA